MFCTNCGKEIEGNAHFCRYCGTPVPLAKPMKRDMPFAAKAQPKPQASTAPTAALKPETQTAPPTRPTNRETSFTAQVQPRPQTQKEPTAAWQTKTATEPSAKPVNQDTSFAGQAQPRQQAPNDPTVAWQTKTATEPSAKPVNQDTSFAGQAQPRQQAPNDPTVAWLTQTPSAPPQTPYPQRQPEETQEPTADYDASVKNAKVCLITALAVLAVGVICALLVSPYLGAALCLAAELTALLPRTKFRKTFRGAHRSITDKKEMNRLEKEAAKQVKKKNKVFSVCTVAAAVALAALISAFLLPLPLSREPKTDTSNEAATQSAVTEAAFDTDTETPFNSSIRKPTSSELTGILSNKNLTFNEFSISIGEAVNNCIKNYKVTFITLAENENEALVTFDESLINNYRKKFDLNNVYLAVVSGDLMLVPDMPYYTEYQKAAVFCIFPFDEDGNHVQEWDSVMTTNEFSSSAQQYMYSQMF